jgi:hypothetical protein
MEAMHAGEALSPSQDDGGEGGRAGMNARFGTPPSAWQPRSDTEPPGTPVAVYYP